MMLVFITIPWRVVYPSSTVAMALPVGARILLSVLLATLGLMYVATVLEGGSISGLAPPGTSYVRKGRGIAAAPMQYAATSIEQGGFLLCVCA
jgi:hypothetical protein